MVLRPSNASKLQAGPIPSVSMYGIGNGQDTRYSPIDGMILAY